MKYIVLFLVFFVATEANGSVKFCSWNLKDFGTTKSEDTIDFIATLLKEYDVVAIQEVVAGVGGPKAVAKLADALNRKGAKWSYTISNPTSGSSYKRERYAFLWKTAKVELVGQAWLDTLYGLKIDREPYLATFANEGKLFTLVNFHAITKTKKPETEIKYLRFFPKRYAGLNLLFAGDFNCPQSHSVFLPLKKQGYLPMLVKQKTSLKKTCVNGNCLASEFDNVFYQPTAITLIKAEAIHFYHAFETFGEAAAISDHLPIVLEFLQVEYKALQG